MDDRQISSGKNGIFTDHNIHRRKEATTATNEKQVGQTHRERKRMTVIRKIGAVLQTIVGGVVILLYVVAIPILCGICDRWERDAQRQDERQRRERIEKESGGT